MNISVTGINRLLNKLERLNHVKAVRALDEVADMVIREIRAACPANTGAARSSVGIDSKSSRGLSAHIAIGLSRKTGNWEQWKGAYFQNYGYHNWGEEEYITVNSYLFIKCGLTKLRII